MHIETPKNAEHITRDAADLYSLAFLLTGHTDVSIDIAADAAIADGDSTPFFSDWMRDWRRRLVIGKALAAIRAELADSARRIQQAHVRAKAQLIVPAKPDLTQHDVEDALLAIDAFPRVVLLLLVFEHMRIADAAALLDMDPALLKKAQAIGLQELTVNLAGANAHSGGNRR